MASIQQAFNQILGSFATASAVGKHFKGQKEQTSATKEQTKAVKEQTAFSLLKDPQFAEKLDKDVVDLFGDSMSEEQRKNMMEQISTFIEHADATAYKEFSSGTEQMAQDLAEASAMNSLTKKIKQKENANTGFKERQSILLDKTGRNIMVREAGPKERQSMLLDAAGRNIMVREEDK